MKIVGVVLLAGAVLTGTAAQAQVVTPPGVGEAPGMPVLPMQDQPSALLQGLDKITGRVSKLTVPVGSSIRFGTLDVTVRACRKAEPVEPPESAAFLEVTDNKANGTRVALFSGWMFASSPGLSALEHPTYDVWVLSCGAA
jgi:hypothetical protein